MSTLNDKQNKTIKVDAPSEVVMQYYMRVAASLVLGLCKASAT